MRIQRLEVEGFRSLKKVSWEPGALNVVIGPNGSGKSNLLKAIIALKHCAQNTLTDFFRAEGGFQAACWDGRRHNISILYEVHRRYHPMDSYDFIYKINIDGFEFNKPYIDSEEFLVAGLPDNGLNFPAEFTPLFSRDHLEAKLHTKTSDETDSTFNIAYEDSLLSYARSPRFAGSISYNFTSFLIRTFICRELDTSPTSTTRLPAITSFEKLVAEDGSNLIQVLHTLYTSDRNFESDIDSAMNAAFGNDYEKLVFPPAADQRVQLRIRWKSLKREQSALDISDGTLRFLYLLAILANPDPSPLIAIDEPETGLHPSMFPIIAEFAQDCSRKSQIIFTTHSPQFLDAFGDTPPTTTVAQWQQGETILKVLDGERLAKWIKHYSMGSMFMSGELEAFD